MYSLIALLRSPGALLPACILFVLTVAQAVMGPLDFHVLGAREGFDTVRVIKLSISVCMFLVLLWGIHRYSAVRAALRSVPSIMITVLLLLTVVGGLRGVSITSIPASIINYINLVFVIVSVTVLGLRTFCFGIVCGAFGTAAYGLYLFYFDPARGIFLEPTEHGQFLERLGGMAHPNSVARSVIVAGLLTVSLYRIRELPTLAMLVLVVLDAWNAVLAVSRTALLGGAFGLAVLFLDRLRSRWGVALITMTIILGSFTLFALFATGNEGRLAAKLVGLVAKSGEASELTTGTGRTAIWAEASRLIWQRPLFGYGMHSGPALLVNHSQATHNAIMHASLSGGLMAGFIMICLQLWTIRQAFYNPNLLISSVSAFLFVSCLTEDTVLETLPGPCTMMWFVCCVVPVMGLSTSEVRDDNDGLVGDGSDPDVTKSDGVAVVL